MARGTASWLADEDDFLWVQQLRQSNFSDIISEVRPKQRRRCPNGDEEGDEGDDA
jgi:hypothetical protein